MSPKKQTKTKAVKRSRPAASMCWFEIPADDPERAKTFYNSLFGWKIKLFPGVSDYWHIDTGGGNDTPDGGLMPRKHEGQPITNYIAVASVTTAAKKVAKLGGTICQPKTAVPHMGYFAICLDTEGNQFALWEMNERAK